MRGPFLRALLPMAMLAVAYYVAARLGLLLAFADSNASPVWPPSGIAVGALLIGSLRWWPGVFAGALAANLVVFIANGVAAAWTIVLVSGVIAAGNTIEGLAAAWLLKRVGDGTAPLSNIQNVYKFALISACACAIAALIGCGALMVAGIVPVSAGWTVLGTWWVGDVVGVLVIAPAVLAWRGTAWRMPGALAGAAQLASLAALCLALWAVFGHAYAGDGSERWIGYLLVPVVGLAAYWYGPRGTTLACMLIAAAAVGGTTSGQGPFASGTLNDALFSIQALVALCSVAGLVLCADMHEMRGRHPDSPLRHRLAGHWATLFGGLGMTLLVWYLVAGATEHRARERFDSAAAGIEQRIVERMRSYEQSLRSARALFGASTSVERDEWHAFVEALAMERNFPGLQSLSYAALVKPGERARFEQAVRAEGFPAFRIWPDGARERSLAVLFLEPFTPENQRAFGFDLLSESVRGDAILRAERSGDPALSARIRLVQEAGAEPQAGFVLFVPVYRNGAPVATPSERSAALQGVVSSPFRMNDMMAALQADASGEVGLEIFDGASAAPAQRMYSSAQPSARERSDYPHPYQALLPVRLQQHQWTLRVTSLPAFDNTIDRQKPQIVLIAGSIISLLFFGVVRALAAREDFAAGRAEQMRSALAQSERKFESLVDSAIEFSIVATDLDGVIRVFSTGAERMLGYEAQAVVGLHTPLLFHLPSEVAQRAAELKAETGEELAGFAPFVAGARAGRVERRECTYVRQDGAEIPVSVVVTPIHDGGAVVGFLGVAYNIAGQQELQASLVRAKELAEAASRAKSEFVANMSHEIRTPMNAVLGISHLLGKTALAPDQRNYLDMIRNAGQSLLGIINDVLDFSKIEAGRMELAPAPFDLDGVLDTCASMMMVDAGDKEIELVVAAQAQLPRRLIGDALRLQQVLSNLLSNAIKFTDRGEVSLLAELVSRDGDALLVRFAVSDTGIGIDAAQQRKLFSPFTQADASMTRRFGGTGLGLTITKSLVELMGGSITIDSAGTGGSRFTAVLPLAVAPGAGDTRPMPDLLHGLRLLVIDDSATSRRGLAECASAMGWTATPFGSGAEALEHLGAFGSRAYPYDAMLVDAHMAGLDGIETVRAAQLFMGARALPFVLMTRAHGREGLVAQVSGMARGATLVKPVTAASLAAALQGVLAGPGTQPDGAGAAALAVHDFIGVARAAC